MSYEELRRAIQCDKGLTKVVRTPVLGVHTTHSGRPANDSVVSIKDC